jgi:hypothetical protein
MDTRIRAYSNLLDDRGYGPVVIPGDAEGSYMVQMLRGGSDEERIPPMPPIDDYPDDYSLLTTAELDVIIAWIDGGAAE